MVFTSSCLWIFIFLTFVSCFFFVLFSYSAKPRSRPVAAKGPPRYCLKKPLREPKGPKDFWGALQSEPSFCTTRILKSRSWLSMVRAIERARVLSEIMVFLLSPSRKQEKVPNVSPTGRLGAHIKERCLM